MKKIILLILAAAISAGIIVTYLTNENLLFKGVGCLIAFIPLCMVSYRLFLFLADKAEDFLSDYREEERRKRLNSIPKVINHEINKEKYDNEKGVDNGSRNL